MLDQFGASLALSADGNTLAVGATGESSALTGVSAGAVAEATAGNGAPNSGAVYVFTRSVNTWSQQAYVKASNTGTNDNFGEALALSADGNTLAAGTRNEASATTGIGGSQTDNSASFAGAVYLY